MLLTTKYIFKTQCDFRDMAREAMYECIRKFISNFDVLDSHNRFIVILTSHEKDIWHSFGHFAFSGFKKRMMSD